MNGASTSQGRRFPPKLERLLLDADVNAHVARYLEAVGLDVLFAPRVDVDIHDDTAIVKWARKHKRFLVCHDRFRDKQTRLKLYFEVYENGGRIIQIAGGPQQPVLMSLGKILVHRAVWLAFFKEHEDGLVVVHQTGMNRKPPDDLHTEIQRMVVDPFAALERPRRPRKRRVKLPRAQQGTLF